MLNQIVFGMRVASVDSYFVVYGGSDLLMETETTPKSTLLD